MEAGGNKEKGKMAIKCVCICKPRRPKWRSKQGFYYPKSRDSCSAGPLA